MTGPGRGRTILIVSQTVALPARRRTWLQAQALRRAGWTVRVLCPRAPGQKRRAVIDGVEIRRFRQPIEGRGRAGLIAEYLFAAFAIGRAMVAARRAGAIDAVLLVNPPDWLFVLALPFRLAGRPIVFDLADLMPVLYEAKFGRRGLVHRLLWALTRFALRHAALVVAANPLYARLARRLGRRAPGTSLVFQSAPEQLVAGRGARAEGPWRIGYFGVLGSHDGVDALIEAVARLASSGAPAHELVIVGDGPALNPLRRLAEARGLSGRVVFRGFLDGAARDAALAGFDIAVIPDPPNRYSQMISMNKAFVYAAFGLPILATPLRGTKRLLGDAACYAQDGSAERLAEGLSALLGGAPLRERLSQAVLDRARRTFRAEDEAGRFVAAIDRLVPPGPAAAGTPARRLWIRRGSNAPYSGAR